MRVLKFHPNLRFDPTHTSPPLVTPLKNAKLPYWLVVCDQCCPLRASKPLVLRVVPSLATA